MKLKYLRHLWLFTFLIHLFLAKGQSNTKLTNLFSAIEKIDKKYEIDNPIWQGKHPQKFTYQTLEEHVEKTEELKEVLNQLIRISDNDLNTQDRINKAIKVIQLQDEISMVTYKINLIPINAEGGFYNWPSFFLPNLPFESSEDFESYVNWLPSFADFIQYHIELMRMGIAEGVLPPKVIIENNVRLLKPWTSDSLDVNPFYQPLKSMGYFGSGNRKIYQAKILRVLEKDIIPAYKELQTFFTDEYLPAALTQVGISAIKNGKEYYENRIRHFTTLEMTPDSVYNTGLAEVGRIKRQMQQIIKDLNFEGSFADFLAFLRTDPQFYASTPKELLSQAAWLSKKAEGELPRLFSKLYELPFTVAPVPDDIAPNYTGGRYVGGNRSENRPGTYWVNTYNLASRPLYTLPALTLHEAAPGHHLQITLAAELKDLPEFRQKYYISAFGEGWGLYAEYLGEEMGMYETPYELFGRYTYEMWRACRLVVDVGLHYKGWSRERAIEYMAGNTALSIHEVNTEIDRYIGWPGQAVSYKIGELTIKRLRGRCEQILGEKFNIQEFHEVILRNGSVPLTVLESEIESYLNSKQVE